MQKILAIMLGDTGRLLRRYLLYLAPPRVANRRGAFASGRPRCLLAGTRLASAERLFIFTGFPGGFTTFSAFGRETTQPFPAEEQRTGLLSPAA